MKYFYQILLGLVLLFISVVPIRAQFDTTDTVYEARIQAILQEEVEQYDTGQKVLNQLLVVEILSGDKSGEEVEIQVNQMLGANEPLYQVGDQVLVNHSSDSTGFEAYYIIDYVRKNTIFRYLFLFVALVLYVGRWRGLRSLLGLAASFVIIFTILLPAIQAGYDPIISALVSSILIMLVTFYLTHGFSRKTTIALAGTSITLLITGFLSRIMITDLRLTGYGAEEASFLQFIQGGDLNILGLLMAGIIISVVGILDDITISQTSVVTELIRANPKLTPAQVYTQAMNVGQDHIASLVNTLILVYVGASLPLTLLFMLDETRTFTTVISYGIVAEEIAKTLIGSIALVMAVPITTLLATRFINPQNVKQIPEEHHHH